MSGEISERLQALRRLMLAALAYGAIIAVLIGGYLLSSAHHEKLAHQHALNSLTLTAKSIEHESAAFSLALSHHIREAVTGAFKEEKQALSQGFSIDFEIGFDFSKFEREIEHELRRFTRQFAHYRWTAQASSKVDNVGPDEAKKCAEFDKPGPAQQVFLKLEPSIGSGGAHRATYSTCFRLRDKAANTIGYEERRPLPYSTARVLNVKLTTNLGTLFDVSTVGVPFEYLLLVDEERRILHQWRQEKLGSDDGALVPISPLAVRDPVLRSAASLLTSDESIEKFGEQVKPRASEKIIEKEDEPKEKLNDAGSPLASARIIEKKLANEMYVFFVVPSSAPYPESVEEAAQEWLFVGMIGKRELAALARGYSVTWGLGIACVFVLAVLTLPFIKVCFQGNRNGYSKIDVAVVVVSGIGLVSAFVLALGGIAVWYLNYVNAQAGALQFAKQLDSRFIEETREWNESIQAHLADFADRDETITRDFLDQCTNDIGDQCTRHGHVEKSYDCKSCPGFELLFTLNSEGSPVGAAVHRWQVPPSTLVVRKRRYFQRALENQSDGRIRNADDSDGLAVSVERVRAYNSGRKLTVLAMPWSEVGANAEGFSGKSHKTPSPENDVYSDGFSWAEEKNDLHSTEARNEAVEPGLDSDPWRKRVFVAVTESKSFNQAVLPPPYSLAVVDRQGDVVFHTNNGLALVENFISATNNEPGVVAAITNGQQTDLDFEYHTMPHFGVTLPLRGIDNDSPSNSSNHQFGPWQLIVFSKKNDLLARTIDTVLTAATAVGYFFLALIIVLGSIYTLTVWWGRRVLVPSTPWPSNVYLPTGAARLGLMLAPALAATLAWVYAANSGSQWLPWCFLLICAATAIILIVSPVRTFCEVPSVPESWHRPIYVGLFCFGLITVAVLPAIVALKQSHDIQTELTHLHTAARLNETAARIDDRLRDRDQYVLDTQNPEQSRSKAERYALPDDAWDIRVSIDPTAIKLGLLDYSSWSTLWHAKLFRADIAEGAGLVYSPRSLIALGLMGVVGLVGLVMLVWVGPRWLSGRVLGFGRKYPIPALPPPPDQLADRKVLLIDGQGDRWRECCGHFGSVHVTDLRERPETESWLPRRTHDVWLIDGVETALFDPDSRKELLNLLEWESAIDKYAPTIIIRARISPVFWLEYARRDTSTESMRWGYLTAEDRYRFEQILRQFSIYAVPVSTEETPEHRKLTPEGAYVEFRYQWRFSTPDERLVLHELAEGDFVNPLNRFAIASLIARGILVDDTPLRFANADFGEFVKTAESCNRWRQLNEERERSTWDVIRGPLMLLMFLSALFIVVEFHEQMSGIATALTSLLAILPVVEKMSGILQGRTDAS